MSVMPGEMLCGMLKCIVVLFEQVASAMTFSAIISLVRFAAARSRLIKMSPFLILAVAAVRKWLRNRARPALPLEAGLVPKTKPLADVCLDDDKRMRASYFLDALVERVHPRTDDWDQDHGAFFQEPSSDSEMKLVLQVSFSEWSAQDDVLFSQFLDDHEEIGVKFYIGRIGDLLMVLYGRQPELPWPPLGCFVPWRPCNSEWEEPSLVWRSTDLRADSIMSPV